MLKRSSAMSARARRGGTRQRTTNALVAGTGAATSVDRGAAQSPATYGLGPYYQANYLYRYQQYLMLYDTAWEARKIVDIPIDDAMRHDAIRQGLSADDEIIISRAWERYNVKRQITRALKQERLLGGSVILGVMRMQDGESYSQPLDRRNLIRGDMLALNVIDVSRLSRYSLAADPLGADYDRITGLMISGVEVDESRMIIYDGDALVGQHAQRLLLPRHYNPLGFGESKLAPLYDTLMRAIGTQQGAYQLVNMSSAMLIMVDNLRQLKAVDSDAVAQLKRTAEQMSIYNAAILEGKDIRVEQHSATFGSVPDLLRTYVEFVAAASDIPITRFLGASPGGLDATGAGDSRNYYDMVDAIRRDKRARAEHKILDWIGASIWGYDDWRRRSAGLVIDYPPLWDMDAVQQATRDEIVVRTILSLYQSGLITPEAAAQELINRELFDSDVALSDVLADQALPPSDLDLGFDAAGADMPGAVSAADNIGG